MCDSPTSPFDFKQKPGSLFEHFVSNDDEKLRWYWQILAYVEGSGALAAVVMTFTIFWNIAQCSSYVNRRFRETYISNSEDRKSSEQKASVQKLAVAAAVA
jgi:hypothetical protein